METKEIIIVATVVLVILVLVVIIKLAHKVIRMFSDKIEINSVVRF